MFTAPWDNVNQTRLDCGKGDKCCRVDAKFGNRRQIMTIAMGGGDESAMEEGNGKMGWGRFCFG
jgi:hypothetical protein